MSKTKHDAMEAYFRPKAKELFGKVLKYNWSPGKESMAFITNYSDKVLKKYIRAAEKEYGFTILITKPYSRGNDDLNLEAMNLAQAFMDWIEEQNRAKVFPEFPANCQIKEMETLQNMPNLAGVDEEAGLARYMVQCRVIYFEREV